jgi:hypothetical protein
MPKQKILINVSRGHAENFIRRMDEQGYDHVQRPVRDGSIEVDFIDRHNNTVSQDYDLIMWEHEAYIGFRPL